MNGAVIDVEVYASMRLLVLMFGSSISVLVTISDF